MARNLTDCLGVSSHEIARTLLSMPDLPLHFKYDYGDHTHTEVTPAVKWAQELAIKYSEYHRMPRLVDDMAEDMSEEETQQVVVLY